MKSFKVNLEDRSQLGRISSKSIGRGRLKKGTSRKRIGNVGFNELNTAMCIDMYTTVVANSLIKTASRDG